MNTRRGMRVLLVALLVGAASVGSAVLPGGVAGAQREPAVELTKELVNARDGDTDNATVRVSQTVNLFDRQPVHVELEGFRPTRNPRETASVGLGMEYPVVVMQCRGAEPTPETCLNERRSVYYAGYDANAPADLHDRTRLLSGPEAAPPTYSPADAVRLHQLRFQAVDGVSYLWMVRNDVATGKPVIDLPTEKNGLPPDASSGGTGMIATRSIPVGVDGRAEFDFEVRQRNSQSSLGCTDTQACSMVIVPIMDMACAEDAPATSATNECADPPRGAPPGESGTGANPFYGARTWFAESNWRNRFVVPLGFAPDPEQCDIRDPRPPLPVFGSELIDVAQQRWGLAYCEGARAADFLPAYTQGSDFEARSQFNQKLGPTYLQDAVVTTEPVLDSPRPVAHAPSAVTGFSVAYTLDDGNGSQVTDLTLSPRLLAKLLTESYSPGKVGTNITDRREFYTGQPIASQTDANKYYWEHPVVAANPRNIFNDQEFLALNPDIVRETPEGSVASQFLVIQKSYPVVFTVRSDIMMELTRYITSDPAARAWLDGAPDEQGMVVNPAWRGMAAFEGYNLRDLETSPRRPRKPGWNETSAEDANYFTLIGAGDECNDVSPSPLLTRHANVANNAESAAVALLDRRGSALPLCTRNTVPVPHRPEDPVPPPQFPGDDSLQTVSYAQGKDEPQNFGNRNLITVTTVPHAELYQLPSAKLVNAGGVAVAPAPGAMLNALAAAEQDPVNGTVLVDHARVTDDAYPGTMLAFTAAPTSGLDQSTAQHYAEFIEFMATDGQNPGVALTDLPPGYDPLTPNLRQQALNAAQAIRDQLGEVPPPPPGGPLGGGMPEGFGGPDATVAPVGSPDGPPGATPESEEDDPKRTAAATDGDGSWLSRWMLPLLLGFALLAAAAAGAVQVASRPDHPVRRALRAVVRR